VILYWYLWVSWAYVFPVVVDRGVSVGEALGESRGLVHRTGWWWTFLVLFLLELVIGAISFALGLIPIVGAVATIVLYPFVLTYVVAMYMQARGEGELIDAVTGYRPVVAGATAAYSGPVSPYTGAPVPPPPAAPPPAGQTYAPAAPPQGAPPAHSSADVPPAAPPPPERPSMPEPPTPPEPPAPAAGA